jgi:hypothetical protein
LSITVYILEGTWWSNKEIPQVLPYFQALENSGNRIKLAHYTFRNAADIKYWISRIPRDEKAFVYFACHGDHHKLVPTDNRSTIEKNDLLNALRSAKKGAIEFLHFGCCGIIAKNGRRKALTTYLNASQSKWVSGYAADVDWLSSTLLDLALVAELSIPYHNDGKKRNVKLSFRGRRFLKYYNQLVRSLGFSGAYKNTRGIELFPLRHRKMAP